MKRIHAIALALVVAAGACNIDDANAAGGFVANLTCAGNQKATFAQINNNNSIVYRGVSYSVSDGTTRKADENGVATFQWASVPGVPNRLAAVALRNDWWSTHQLQITDTVTQRWVWCAVDSIQEL